MGKTSKPTHPLWKPVNVPPVAVEVVGECCDILAVSKPVGMDTIQVNGWVTGYPSLKDVVYKAYPYARFLNRIDRDTSGLVLFALSRERRAYLCSVWFGGGSVNWRRKVYLAIIPTPDWDVKVNDNPLKKDGKWEDATTKFTLLREGLEGLALVSAELVSHGRTHQIRRHLQELGYPILGDTKYGGEYHGARGKKGQFLHAWKNEIRLADGTWVRFTAQVPEDFPIRAPGGTCLKKLWVEPLNEFEQIKTWHEHNSPRQVDLDRKEHEAYPDYVARRAEKQRRRDERLDLEQDHSTTSEGGSVAT